MSALSEFLDRHGIDETFRARAGFYASVGTIAIATALAPLKAKAEESYLGRHSPIGGEGISERLGMIAERANDRLADMVAIRRAISSSPDLANPHDGRLAARILVEVNNRLYNDTPYPELAQYDMTPLGLPGNLAEGAAMEYAVGAINFQKDTLLNATQALKVIAQAYDSGSHADLQRGVEELDAVLQKYNLSEERVLDNINSSLHEMRSDEGWVRGRSVNY